MTSQVRVVKKKRGRGLWPILGLIMMIAIGAISWIVAPYVIDAVQGMRASFGAGTDPDRLRLYAAAGVFFVLISFTGLIIAFARPRKGMIDVKESDLIKERQQRQLQAAMERKRQLKLNRQMRQEIRARDEVNRSRFGDNG